MKKLLPPLKWPDADYMWYRKLNAVFDVKAFREAIYKMVYQW